MSESRVSPGTVRFQEGKNQKARNIKARSRFFAELRACFPLCFPLRAKIGLYEILHAGGAVLPHALREVTVSVQSKGRAGVAEVALDGLDIVACPDGIDGVCVTQIMEAHPGQSGGLHRSAEPVRHIPLP